MMIQSVSAKLLQFPLFLGMGKEKVMTIVSRVRLDFLKVTRGNPLAQAGEPCQHIYLLNDGRLKMLTASSDGDYSMEETVEAPAILPIEHSFGRRQTFRSTFIAIRGASLIAIGKADIAKMCEMSLTFRLNLQAMLAERAKAVDEPLWGAPPKTLEDRIVRFIAHRCQLPTGPKALNIRMVRLAEEVGRSRLEVSRTLNRMDEEGRIKLRRARIEIDDLQKFLGSCLFRS